MSALDHELTCMSNKQTIQHRIMSALDHELTCMSNKQTIQQLIIHSKKWNIFLPLCLLETFHSLSLVQAH